MGVIKDNNALGKELMSGSGVLAQAIMQLLEGNLQSMAEIKGHYMRLVISVRAFFLLPKECKTEAKYSDID